MNLRLQKCILLIAFLLYCQIRVESQNCSEFILPTKWAAEVLNQHIPLPEYPRPQMVRQEWKNLNGFWDYMGGENLPNPETSNNPPIFPQLPEKIKVPFPPESDLSGIRRNGEKYMWYRKDISIPESWNGKNILINFGAVDRFCSVFINGNKIGTHEGGYDSFYFDITKFLKKGTNTLVVGVYDPNDGKAPCGKNGPKGDYIYTSGIWQTVWLEPVGRKYITTMKLNPNLQTNTLEVVVQSNAEETCNVTAIATSDGKTISSSNGNTGERFTIKINNPHLWTPDDPYLYGLVLQLKNKKGKIIDEIESYFGMRSVELKCLNGIMRPMLNNEFVMHIGLLDQGYWPDGAFTAPTDNALLYDIELAKRAGFNVIRKHIKVEPQRWYYHCDRLGIMVWQDMPNLWEPDGKDSIKIRKQFREELKAMIDQHTNSPSIVVWVPFNENWGAFDVSDITNWVKKYDPTRLVNGNSGFNYAPGYRPAYGDSNNGDFKDMHHYGKIEPSAIAKPDDKRAASLGEFGGKGLFVRGHLWPVRNDAYEMMTSKEALTDTYVLMMNEIEQMCKYYGLSTAIYTQTTDVEHEINGMVTYDRSVEKMDFEKIRNINKAVIDGTRIKQ